MTNPFEGTATFQFLLDIGAAEPNFLNHVKEPHPSNTAIGYASQFVGRLNALRATLRDDLNSESTHPHARKQCERKISILTELIAFELAEAYPEEDKSPQLRRGGVVVRR